MLTVSQLAKAHAGRPLFRDADLQVNRGDRIGLVGPNGAGKSTLFRIILGHEEPDAGRATLQRGTTTGFLPQEGAPAGDETVLDLATDFGGVDGPTVARAKQILAGLAFRPGDFDRPARTLSGGWIMRAHLARLLVQAPDLLLLDEPTNHLDLETLLWFQDHLQSYPGAVVVISHDREFLNQLVTAIVEFRAGRLFRYAGNYDAFLEQREANEANLLAAHKNQQREIARLMEFVNRFRAKNTKATQAQAKLKQIARMVKIEAPEGPGASVNFAFPQPPRSGHRVITLRGVHHAYGELVVYRDLEFEAERGQRIVLVGPNGAGKSTLLKLLAGVLTVQQGERKLGYHVRAGYYAQHRTEMLRPERTVLDEALDTPARVSEEFVRTLLGCFLFRGDDVFKPVGVLSGGEKSRLALVKLLLDPPNLLLMDEPTTHLDLASLDALVAALGEFTGTLIFISHDVHLIRSLADRVVHVNAGRLTHYAGDYDYYLAKTGAAGARAGLTAGHFNYQPAAPEPARPSPPAVVAPTAKERRRVEAGSRQVRAAQQRLVDDLERQIAGNEARQHALAAELEAPATYETPGRAVAINRELQGLLEEDRRLHAEWEAAAQRLLELERTG